MSGRKADVVIAGGGLAGGLIALALHRADPSLDIAIAEAGETLGGNHRWSWFASDLDAHATSLLTEFPTTSWDGGYTVKFPRYTRTLKTPYRSLSSADFHAHLAATLPEGTILTGQRVTSLDRSGITLDNGDRIEAAIVIDCRGFEPSPHLKGGWQVFMGKHFRTVQPHGIDRPAIMDAALVQHAPQCNGHAYRFVYTLPTGERELFVEDTYYADQPGFDAAALSARIDSYARKFGDLEETHRETGVLPVITGGNFIAYQQSMAVDGVAIAGARGGFVHPLTSYTLPQAAKLALLVAGNRGIGGAKLAGLVAKEAQAHWRATRFYRMLGAMLFDAARPQDRFLIFQRFYRLPEELIERFYAGRSTRLDMMRVLTGKPPVPVSSAIAALLRGGTPLAMEDRS